MHMLTDIILALSKASRVAITTHIRPDGDAIGSSLALKHILEGVNKKVFLTGITSTPKRLDFLVHPDAITDTKTLKPSDVDLLVALDTGDTERLEPAIKAWLPETKSINIDHHPSNTGFATLNYVVPSASSVGELIVDVATGAGWPITPEAAEALWVAIVTDTGRFAYSNTSPATLRTAATLVALGVQTDSINHRLYETATPAQVRLQGKAAASLNLDTNGEIAVISLSQADFAECNATGEDTEEIIAIARRVEGVNIAVFLYELPGTDPLQTKISLRTNPPFDAARFCSLLGGGGHARAAGCSLALPLNDARQQILQNIRQHWFQA